MASQSALGVRSYSQDAVSERAKHAREPTHRPATRRGPDRGVREGSQVLEFAGVERCDSRCYTLAVPTSYPRVGLLLDEDMSTALAVVREHVGSSVSQAGLVRKAVFEGVALEAILREATTRSARQETALQLVREMRALIETLTLPRLVKEGVIAELDRVSHDADVQHRRLRQRVLLNSSNPHGRATLDLKETFDALERQPA